MAIPALELDQKILSELYGKKYWQYLHQQELLK